MEFADVKVKCRFATIVEAEKKVVMENLMQGIQTCIKANNNVYTGATTVKFEKTQGHKH